MTKELSCKLVVVGFFIVIFWTLFCVIPAFLLDQTMENKGNLTIGTFVVSLTYFFDFYYTMGVCGVWHFIVLLGLTNMICGLFSFFENLGLKILVLIFSPVFTLFATVLSLRSVDRMLLFLE